MRSRANDVKNDDQDFPRIDSHELCCHRLERTGCSGVMRRKDESARVKEGKEPNH